MNFRDAITEAVQEEAKKLLQRHHDYHNALALEHERLSRRITNPPPKAVKIPPDWSSDRKFNPFYVYAKRKAIGRSIAAKIVSLQYKPEAPILRQIAKPSGGTRQISVYQIPDNAVSALFYRTLLKKNKHRFSASSYAYRDDRNAHFAIQDISIDLKNVSRMFIAEYDFSKFFDSISHSYLFAQFKENGFSISPRDEHVIGAFLDGRTTGVPQGTSISLFLANLVCWRLDRQLEREGLRFARYADDTVIWSPDYSKIVRAAEMVSTFSNETGVEINTEKSKGIRLLCPDHMPAEVANRTDYVDFLGYSISVDKIGIKERSIEKIKRQINYILYQHLIQPLRGPKLRALEIPSAMKGDRDLLAGIGSIRRYLYGNLNDDFIRRYLAGSSGRLFYKGVMSFYPLLSDQAQMQRLDGWLVNQVWKAVRLRGKLLKQWKHDVWHIFPFNLHRTEFTAGLRARQIKKRRLYAIPSFVVIYLALRKAVSEDGVLQLLAKEEYSSGH